MEERFEILSRMVWGVHGDVQKLKMQIAAELGIKGAHVFLIYLLRNYPDGLTAAQLCDMNRSTGGLISRETAELLRQGIIEADRESDRRRYGCKYVLTEKGWEMARRISAFAMEVQQFVSAEIPHEELVAFYHTFGMLLKKFDQLTGQSHLVQDNDKNHKGES